MHLRIFTLLLLLPSWLAAAPEARPLSGEEIRAQHKAAAERYFETLRAGLQLSGRVSENGSPGTFDAWFHGGVWVVRQQFGDLTALHYDGPEGSWSRSNYSLPYESDREGAPASACLNMLTSGDYLEPGNWERFRYVDDTAGSYNFVFAPEGLPEAKVALYADASEPDYLQIMSVEVDLSPSDADSHTYRSFYYYKAGADGKLYTERETGREIDATGETSSFSEYVVETVKPISALPPEAQFSFERVPPQPPQIAAPVDIPVDVGAGYFIIPLTFAGSDQTWNFIFDTGASASLFTPAAAAAAGLTPSVNVPAHGHGGRVDFQLGLVKSASVGRADAPAEQRVPLAPFPAARVAESNKDVLAAFESYNVGGILGVALLHQYVATFDNFESKVTLIPHTQFAGADVPRPNLEIWLDVEDLIYLTGYVSDGQRPDPLRGQVVLDTGLQQKLSVLGETMEANGLQLEKVTSRNNTVLGGIKKFDYVKVPRFDVAALVWTDVEAAVTDDDKGTLSARGLLGFVGVPFFFGTRVTIDLFGQRMYVRPLSEAEQQQLLERLGDKAKDAPKVEGTGDATTEPEEEAETPGARSKEEVDRDRLRELQVPDEDPEDEEDGE